MAAPLVSDALWTRIEPLIPKHQSPTPKGGRPPVEDRAALEGILFVLKTGIPWEDLPPQFGCCGMSCWRRLRDWQAAGVWDAAHRALLDRLGSADKIAWERACLDTASVPAKRGEPAPGATPPTAAGPGSSSTS